MGRREVRWLKEPFEVRRLGLLVCIGLIYAVLVSLAQIARYRGLYENSIYNLGYGFGNLLKSLDEGKGYSVDMHGIPFVAHRLPFVPLLLIAFQKLLLGNFAAVWVAKNLLMFGVSVGAVAALVRERKPPRWVVLVVVAVCLFTWTTAFFLSSLDNEEAYLGHLVPAAFALLLLRLSPTRMALLGLACAAIVLTKSSILGVAALIALLAFAKGIRALQALSSLSFMPLVGAAAAAIGWGLFVQARTGFFAFGAKSSSFNGMNLHKGNSEFAVRMYPERNLDEIPYSKMAPPPGSVRTEWEVDAFHNGEAQRFKERQPDTHFELVGRRAYVALLSVSKTGLTGDKKPGLDRGMLLLRPFLLLGLALGLFQAFRTRAPLALAFLLCVAAYVLPFLLGFIYYRHLVPVATLTGVYLLARAWKPQTS